jgi:flagellar biosynthetic protein FliR
MTQTIHLGLPHFQTFVVVLIRIGAILAAMPLLGSRSLPAQFKAGLATALALVLVPFVGATSWPSDTALFLLGLIAEFLIGLVIGLAVRSLFASFEVAGELIGSQMGFSIVQIFDPVTSHNVPLIGQLHTVLASLIFLSLNAHLLVVHAIGESFRWIPPFGATLAETLGDEVVRLFQGGFLVALKLAAPVLIVTLVVNLVLALLGRTVPHLNVFVLSFPLTIFCGLFVFGLALPAIASLCEAEFLTLHESILDLLRGIGHG